MKRSDPIREARHVFLITVAVRLVLSFLGVLAALAWAPSWPVVAVVLAPGLTVSVLAAMTFLEKLLGPRYLAIPLLCDVALTTFRFAPLMAAHALQIVDQEADALGLGLAEPFAYVLVPLVLLAWAYGRWGGLVGAVAATVAQLLLVTLGVAMRVAPPIAYPQAMARIALLLAAPLIVSILAERERRYVSELESAHRSLQRHAATVEQLAVSRERNRMARDLHDTLAHSLAALTVHLGALGALLRHDPAAASDAARVALDMARQGLDESRRAIAALRPDPVTTLGLIGALQGEVSAFQTRTGVSSRLTVAGDEPDLTEAEARALFRIAQEALTNAERHAQARNVTVRLASGDDRTDLDVEDDGRGFDTGAVSDQSLGLLGMRERASLVGATLSVTSVPHGGTHVHCSLRR